MKYTSNIVKKGDVQSVCEVGRSIHSNPIEVVSTMLPNLSLLEKFVLSDALKQMEHSHPQRIPQEVSRYFDYLEKKDAWERCMMAGKSNPRIKFILSDRERKPE